MVFPRVVRFPVPLDKGNEGSGDEIGSLEDAVVCHFVLPGDV